MYRLLRGTNANCTNMLIGKTGGIKSLVNHKHKWESKIKPNFKQYRV
jgi:hypothetical protein